MRRLKVVLALILLSGGTLLHAQHYVGVRGGYAGGMIHIKPLGNLDPGLQWGGYSGGISWKFYSETKVVGGIQLDLQYTGKGYMYDTRPQGDTSYHRTLHAVELPFMWQPHFYLFQRNARIFMNLGVSFSYNLSSRHWYESKEKGIYNDETYPMLLTRDNRFGYGLAGGFGVSILAGRWDITLEGRYTLGFSDILRNTDKYEYNPRRSPVDQINISAGAYYRIGKGGLRAAPSARMEQRMSEAEARRILRRREKGKESAPEELSPRDSIPQRNPADSVLSRQMIDSLLSLPVRGISLERTEQEKTLPQESAHGTKPVPEPDRPDPQPAAGEAPKSETPAGGAAKPSGAVKPETP